MKKLVITLEITDSFVVSEYENVDKELILDDLQYGDLIGYCEMVKVEVQDA